MIQWRPGDICCFEQLDENNNPIHEIHVDFVPEEGLYFAKPSDQVRGNYAKQALFVKPDGKRHTFVDNNAFLLIYQNPESCGPEEAPLKDENGDETEASEGFYIVYDDVEIDKRTGLFVKKESGANPMTDIGDKALPKELSEFLKKGLEDIRFVNPIYDYLVNPKTKRREWVKCAPDQGTGFGMYTLEDNELIRFGPPGGVVLRFRLPPPIIVPTLKKEEPAQTVPAPMTGGGEGVVPTPVSNSGTDTVVSNPDKFRSKPPAQVVPTPASNSGTDTIVCDPARLRSKPPAGDENGSAGNAWYNEIPPVPSSDENVIRAIPKRPHKSPRK